MSCLVTFCFSEYVLTLFQWFSSLNKKSGHFADHAKERTTKRMYSRTAWTIHEPSDDT